MTENIGGVVSSAGDYLLKMWHVSVPCGPRPPHKHSHTRFEISYVDSGSAVYTVGDRCYNISEGDMMVFSSNETHCITNVSEGGLKITNLHFEPRYIWGRSSDSLSDRHINFCFSHREGFENRIPREKADRLRGIMRMLQGELEMRKEEYPLMVKSYLNSMIVSLIRDYGYAEDGISVSRSHVRSIRNAVLFIDSHLCEELTLQSISQAAGLSPNYFSALFKKINNITLWDYISSKRIDEAIKRIMADSGENMINIASECGFNNTANFNKAFKKFTGMTPTEYRESGDIFIH